MEIARQRYKMAFLIPAQIVYTKRHVYMYAFKKDNFLPSDLIKSRENHRALSHGVATYQWSNMIFETMVNTKELILSKTLPQSPIRLTTHRCHQ